MDATDSPSTATPRLTSAEIEIVLRIVAGKNARQIAAELNLTEDQVQNHILALFEKTACDTRTQLAAAWSLWGQEDTRASHTELRAQIALLKVERNALRQRVGELESIVLYLTGIDPRGPSQTSPDPPLDLATK